MKCLANKEIEKFVKLINYESSVNPEWVKHINSCYFCQERVNELLIFTQNLKSLLESKSSTKERTLLQRLIGKNKNLHIAYPIISSNPVFDKSYSTLSAENIKKPKLTKYKNITTLKTNDDTILVRIMRNINTNEIVIFLISEDKQKYKNVIVYLSFLDKEYKSDKDGKVNLGKVELPDIDEIVIQIKTN